MFYDHARRERGLLLGLVAVSLLSVTVLASGLSSVEVQSGRQQALAGGSLLGVIALGGPMRLSFVAAVLLALLAVAGIGGLADKARSASSQQETRIATVDLN